jgi:hypothetical protein
VWPTDLPLRRSFHAGSICCFPDESRFAHRLATAQCLRFLSRSGTRLARARPRRELPARAMTGGLWQVANVVCGLHTVRVRGSSSRPALRRSSPQHRRPYGRPGASSFHRVNAPPAAVHPPAARKLAGTGLVQMPWTNRNAAPGQRIVAWSAAVVLVVLVLVVSSIWPPRRPGSVKSRACSIACEAEGALDGFRPTSTIHRRGLGERTPPCL